MKTLKFFFSIIFFSCIILNTYAEVIDYIAAIVDDEIIISSELKEKMAAVTDYYRQNYSGAELDNMLKKAEQSILNDAIEEKILLLNAEKSEIEVTQEEIEKNIEEFKKKFSNTDEFYAELKKEGITLSSLREKTEERIKVNKFVRLVILRDIRVTEEETTNFYEENKESFSMPGQVKISQILVKDSSNNKTETEILKKLDSGEDFSAVAKLYSQGPHASDGGNLGFVYMEQLQPQLREAVSELEVGKYTKPIYTSAGCHIIKLEAKKLPEYTPISDVKDMIRKKLYEYKSSEKYRDWMENSKKDIDIVIFPKTEIQN